MFCFQNRVGFCTTIHFVSTIKSLCPIDSIRRQRSGWTSTQVMACCLKAPSHFLNQYCSNFFRECISKCGLWNIGHLLRPHYVYKVYEGIVYKQIYSMSQELCTRVLCFVVYLCQWISPMTFIFSQYDTTENYKKSLGISIAIKASNKGSSKRYPDQENRPVISTFHNKLSFFFVIKHTCRIQTVGLLSVSDYQGMRMVIICRTHWIIFQPFFIKYCLNSNAAFLIWRPHIAARHVGLPSFIFRIERFVPGVAFYR